MENDQINEQSANVEESLIVNQLYGFREEEQLTQIWGARDRVEHEQWMRGLRDTMDQAQSRSRSLCADIEHLWERFVTLSLERTLSNHLREFLDELGETVQRCDQWLNEIDCEADQLRGRIRKQQQFLEEKIKLLEPLAHRISTQNHIGMMLARVEELEAHLSADKSGISIENTGGKNYKKSTASSNLLYLRIRLMTTRSAIIAANRSNELSDLLIEVAALLPEIEQLKSDLFGLAVRVDCINDLGRYWLAYLDISTEKNPKK